MDVEDGNEATMNNNGTQNKELETQTTFHQLPNRQTAVPEKHSYKSHYGITLNDLGIKAPRLKLNSLWVHENTNTFHQVADYVKYITKDNSIIGYFINDDMDILNMVR